MVICVCVLEYEAVRIAKTSLESVIFIPPIAIQSGNVVPAFRPPKYKAFKRNETKTIRDTSNFPIFQFSGKI